MFWFTLVRSVVALEPSGPIQTRPDPTRRPRRNTTYLQRPKKSRAASNGRKSGTQELHLRGLTSKTEAAAAESELLLPRTARTRCSPRRRKGSSVSEELGAAKQNGNSCSRLLHSSSLCIPASASPPQSTSPRLLPASQELPSQASRGRRGRRPRSCSRAPARLMNDGDDD